MNALEIKNRRKELGLTQVNLAKKLGVSLKTVGNYENGGEIPETKQALLLDILSNNAVENKNDYYDALVHETDPRIIQALEKLKEVEMTIEIAKKIKSEEDLLNHNIEIANLLKVRINLIRKSNKEIAEENN